jgi:hypothetical protein
MFDFETVKIFVRFISILSSVLNKFVVLNYEIFRMKQSVILLIIYVSQLEGSFVHFYPNGLVFSSVKMLYPLLSFVFLFPFSPLIPHWSLSLVSE